MVLSKISYQVNISESHINPEERENIKNLIKQHADVKTPFTDSHYLVEVEADITPVGINCMVHAIIGLDLRCDSLNIEARNDSIDSFSYDGERNAFLHHVPVPDRVVLEYKPYKDE